MVIKNKSTYASEEKIKAKTTWGKVSYCYGPVSKHREKPAGVKAQSQGLNRSQSIQENQVIWLKAALIWPGGQAQKNTRQSLSRLT